jgi:diguanylate cyclase (GGDEF)-like protein/PAS domain S-box-containing protein
MWSALIGRVRAQVSSREGAPGASRALSQRHVAALERALLERSQLLRMAGKVARFGGWVVPLPPSRVVWSEEVCEIHDMPSGTSPTLEEAIDFYAPEFRKVVRQAFELCTRDGTPFDMELRLVTARGRTVWVRAVGEAGRDAAGRITEVHGAFQDISRRKQFEEQLEATGRRLANVLESITDAFFVLDREWRFVYLNGQGARLLRRESQHLVGRSVWEAFPEAVGSRFEEEYRRAMEQNVVVRFEEFFAPLDAWFDVSAFPSVEGLSVYFRDATEKKRTDLELRKRVLQQELIAGFSAKALSGAGIDELLEEAAQVVSRGLGGAPGAPVDVSASGAAPVGDPAQPFAWLATYARQKGWSRPEDESFVASVVNTMEVAVRRKHGEERLAHLSQFDALTELPNRALFQDRLGQLLARAKRHGEAVAVMSLDLDRFKRVNESFGHEAGNALLKLVAERVRGCLRGSDTLARVGADEFLVSLPERADAGDAGVVAGKIAAAMSRPFALGAGESFVTASIGIALYPQDGDAPEALVRNADAAMLRAKELGKGYEYYRREMNARVAERVQIETELRTILERGDLDRHFELHYQPKVSVRDETLCGFEALMRWEHPARGLVAPSVFIPVLEETGLIVEAGLWALRKASADYWAWQREGLAPPRIAVNVSAAQLRRGGFVESVRQCLSHTPAATTGLELELTESVVMQRLDEVVPQLKDLKSMGLTIAIDDFGTGYSSLSYLAKLPVDAVKIDRSFIHTMGESTHSLAIVSSVISLAHALGLRVVAEGVEQRGQTDSLRLLRCDEMQGYLFGKPAPAASAVALLRQRRGG